MKTYPKEVLEAENKMIMQGHEAAIKAACGPVAMLIVSSLTGLVGFGLYHLINAIFA